MTRARGSETRGISMDTKTQTPYQQQGRGWMQYPAPGTFLRLFYKAPLLQWRLGLGWMLRKKFRMLVLTTRGRQTGRPRHTMLEHTFFEDHVYLAPGWGERTQWYRNIVADPRVTVQRGGPAESAIARRVTDDHELRSLYEASHGRSPVWKQYLGSWGVEDAVEDYVAKKDRLIILRLDPSSEPPLPGVRADLAWVWPIFALAAAATYLALR